MRFFFAYRRQRSMPRAKDRVIGQGKDLFAIISQRILVRNASARRTLYVLAILSAWIGTLVLGWMAWEFWTHSSLP